MRKSFRTVVLCAALLLALGACERGRVPSTAAPAAGNTAAPPPVPTVSPAGTGAAPSPLTEEGVRASFSAQGAYEVRAITPYEGDFLVEADPGYGDGSALLVWVFGPTGRQVYLTGLEDLLSYDILSRGVVEVHTSGASMVTPWKDIPQTYTVYAPWDGMDAVPTTEQVTWLDPAEPLYVGAWDGESPAGGGRYEQLYDARIDADGLSFSFIPNGDSLERYQTFFPAVTSIPNFQTGFDPDTRQFTLRLFQTCLESGGISREHLEGGAYHGLYPYSFPEGPLGRDSHFLTGVEIHADGEDTVLTAVLTERAHRFTVEISNLGYDDLPSFRLVFRGENPDLDG